MDPTAPTVTGVPNDGSGADIDYQTSASTLSANWAGVFADADTGIASVRVGDRDDSGRNEHPGLHAASVRRRRLAATSR